jgi:dienelactone hydrolase
MFRSLTLAFLATALIGNASPARNHYYWFPASSDARPRPWAVMLPRAAGIGKLEDGNQYRDLARLLNARGLDAMVVDYDAAASLVRAAKGKTGPKLAAIVADALADGRSQGRMDMRCPGVAIGWSRGAEGALTLASTDEGGRTGVKAAIVYYPSVRGQERPWRQLHPVLALQGTGDNVAPAASLQKLVADRAANGIEFDVHLYAGAHHRFDVAHPVDDPTGNPPADFDAKAHADALAAIGYFIDKYAITTGGCALD